MFNGLGTLFEGLQGWEEATSNKSPHITDSDPIVEARKLEHQYPHALKVEYRGS